MSEGWAPLLWTAEGTPTLNTTGLVEVLPTGCGEQDEPRGSRQKKPGWRRRCESTIIAEGSWGLPGMASAEASPPSPQLSGRMHDRRER